MPSIPEEPEQAETEAECFTMPDFLKPLHNLEVVESKEAVLECQVAGLPYPSITWFHNGTRIDSTDDRKMMQCRAPRPPRGTGGSGRGARHRAADGLFPLSPQTRTSIAWCSRPSATRTLASTKASLPTKWGRPRAMRTSTSRVGDRWGSASPQHGAGVAGDGTTGAFSRWGWGAHTSAHLSHADVVPTPPDGPPTVALVTGRAITLTWNKPKWLDTAIGEGAGGGQQPGGVPGAPC